MSKAYDIMLALFIIGLVSTALNAIAILPGDIPAQDINMNDSVITDLTGISQSSETNLMPFFNSMMVIKLLGFFLSSFTTVFYILPLLASWGIEGEIAAMFQVLIWIIEAVFIVQFVTGRSIKAME